MTDFPINIHGGIKYRTLLSDFLRDNPGLPDEERESVKSLKPGYSTACGIGGGGFTLVSRPRQRVRGAELNVIDQ